MRPERCADGMPVWYRPSVVTGIAFRGYIVGEPKLVGGTWCVRLKDLPQAYGDWRGTPGRKSVAAAAVDSCEPDWITIHAREDAP